MVHENVERIRKAKGVTKTHLAKVFDESADYILGRSKTRNLKGENNEVDEPEYVRLFKKLSPEKRKLILELLEGYVDK